MERQTSSASKGDGMADAIERKPHLNQLSKQDATRLHASMKNTALALTKLAVKMGEPTDRAGDRWTLMAEDLSDLPSESVLYAVEAWSRGESKHLSQYQRDRSRVGVFFPKCAELREIAQLHAREQAGFAATRRQLAEYAAWEADRTAHPENYVSLAQIVKDVIARLDAKRTLAIEAHMQAHPDNYPPMGKEFRSRVRENRPEPTAKPIAKEAAQ